MIWSQCCYSCDRSVAAKAVQLLVQLVIVSSRQDLSPASIPDLSQDAALAVESLILGLCLADRTEEKQLKIVLASAVQLSHVAGPEVSTAIVNCLTRLLLQSSGSTLVLLCQSLAAIGDSQPSATVPALVDIMSMLKKLTGQNEQELLFAGHSVALRLDVPDVHLSLLVPTGNRSCQRSHFESRLVGGFPHRPLRFQVLIEILYILYSNYYKINFQLDTAIIRSPILCWIDCWATYRRNISIFGSRDCAISLWPSLISPVPGRTALRLPL